MFRINKLGGVFAIACAHALMGLGCTVAIVPFVGLNSDQIVIVWLAMTTGMTAVNALSAYTALPKTPNIEEFFERID